MKAYRKHIEVMLADSGRLEPTETKRLFLRGRLSLGGGEDRSLVARLPLPAERVRWLGSSAGEWLFRRPA